MPSCSVRTWKIAVDIVLKGDISHPLVQSCLLLALLTLLTFVVSQASRNYSQVDKLWSLTPFFYSLCMVTTTTTNGRSMLMALLVGLWSVRLTFHFYRRGGYQWPALWRGDEDYRWRHIRSGQLLAILQYPVPWTLFNLLFISLYQMVLLWLLAAPSVVVYVATAECGAIPLNGWDGLVTVLLVVAIVIETMADNQQFAFQTQKKQYARNNTQSGEMCGRNFKQSGLFAIVRKPNYAAEQAIWILYYFFSWNCVGHNWSMIGWILLLLLFQGSARFTEQLSQQKYPRYKEYMEEVPLFVPSVVRLLKRKPKST